MKSKLYFIALFLLLSITFVSCNNDDDESETTITSVEGIWQVNSSELVTTLGGQEVNRETEMFTEPTRFTFAADGTCSIDDNYDQNITGLYLFSIDNWDQNGNEITFNKGTDEETKATIKSINASNLVLEAIDPAFGVTNTYTISMSK